ncbi:MAG: hypothetical protein HN849_14020 [Victivallales bacterium]|nr:hypothetical protein [Victivallales bacterium]
MHDLTGECTRLAIDDMGCLGALEFSGQCWLEAPTSIWEMVLQEPSSSSVLGRRHEISAADAKLAVTSEDDTVELCWHAPKVAGRTYQVTVCASIECRHDEFVFRFKVLNEEPELTVRELRGPVLPLWLDPKDPPALLWPSGAGERIADPTTVGLLELPFPTRLCMGWVGFDAGDRGLYIGSHDASLRTRMFRVDATESPGRVLSSINHYPFAKPGSEWSSGAVVVRPYGGTWHEAARRYRGWAHTWWTDPEPPAWVRRTSGWQLVILKQQNGEIHWPYTDMDRLIALGKESGLDVLGLYGWAEGGHDRRYPIYDPDPALGGETALRAGIEAAHEAGFRVVLYVNGQLLDMQTEWYAAHGAAATAVSERGEVFGESWLKYSDAPMIPMGYGCQSSQVWSDRLLEVAQEIQQLGADGIIYDQIGSAHPMFCFSDEHNHSHPAQAIGPGAAANLQRIQKCMAEIDPEFIIMTEHVTDGVNRFVDLTHGCGGGFTPGGRSFPEMLRFTFPEIISTQRHPTPVLDQATASWACMYGFRHEVEYRYLPDRLYVEKGVKPVLRDYARIPSRPNVSLMQQTDPRQAHAHLKRLTAFERRNADLLRDGTFRDVEGFSCPNPALIAKGFSSGQELGVLVWNPTENDEAVVATVPGATLRRSDSPEGKVDAVAPLAAGAIRLLRYSRKAGE